MTRPKGSSIACASGKFQAKMPRGNSVSNCAPARTFLPSSYASTSEPVALVSRESKYCAAPAPKSLVQLCGPVEDDGHGLRLGILHLRKNQKSLAVGPHVINALVIK